MVRENAMSVRNSKVFYWAAGESNDYQLTLAVGRSHGLQMGRMRAKEMSPRQTSRSMNSGGQKGAGNSPIL